MILSCIASFLNITTAQVALGASILCTIGPTANLIILRVSHTVYVRLSLNRIETSMTGFRSTPSIEQPSPLSDRIRAFKHVIYRDQQAQARSVS